jgi:uncharacterized protein YjbI with pentapeptide repeats
MRQENSIPKGEMNQQALNELIRQHEMWLANPGSGMQIQLSDTDFGGLQLKGNLKSSQFSACQFDYATFDSSNLESAVFTNCNLVGAKLTACECNNTFFTGCDFTSSEIDTLKANQPLHIDNCDFSKSIIQNVILLNADFKLANFTDSILKNVKFMGKSNVSGTFLRASIFSSSFINSDLVLFNFTDVTLGTVFFDDSNINLVAPAINVNFSDKSSLKGVTLDGQFINCILSAVDFRKSDDVGPVFSGVTFTDCMLDSALMNYATCTQTKFINCNMTNADLSQADFRLCEMTDCQAQGLKANEISAYKANFSTSALVSSEFSNSHLSRCNFSNTILDGCFFEFADLSGADLSNATINQTAFGGANLSGATFVDGDTCRVGSLGRCRKLFD